MLNILLVEDDEDMASLLVVVLTKHGFHCSVAGSLSEVRRRLQGERFDVVLLDLILPDGSGLDLLPDLEASPSRGAAVIVASGNVNGHLRGLRGIRGVLQKPFDMQKLLQSIEEAP